MKFRQCLNLHSPCFAKQNGHIIEEKTDKACLVRFCHLDHVVTDFVSFVTAFLLKNPSLTHAVVSPFRNRPRSSRLFGCKRPHNGFVSLPPCFGLLLLVLLNVFFSCDFCSLNFQQYLNLHSPYFAKQKGDKLERTLTKM